MSLTSKSVSSSIPRKTEIDLAMIKSSVSKRQRVVVDFPYIGLTSNN